MKKKKKQEMNDDKMESKTDWHLTITQQQILINQFVVHIVHYTDKNTKYFLKSVI